MPSGRESTIARPRAPMFSLAMLLASGILLGQFVWRPPVWIAIGLTVFIASATVLLSRRARLAWCVAHLAVMCLGWVALVGQCERVAAETPNISHYVQGDEVTITGRVSRVTNSRRDDFFQIEIETENLQQAKSSSAVGVGLRLNLYPRAKAAIPNIVRRLTYGHRISLIAKLRQPRNFRNPGALDYEGYLRNRGIAAIGSAKAETITLLGNSGDWLGRWQHNMRTEIVERIQRIWPGEQAALMSAMLIGERTALDPDLTTTFQRSGTYHVLVVSGMNVGILALVIFWLLRQLQVSEIAASFLTVSAASAYAFLCDGGAPIVRATLMLGIFLISRLFYRQRAPLNAVGTAAAIVLLADPTSLFDASFQLTFLCVLVIGGIGIPILERTSETWRRGLRNLQSTGFDLALPPKVVQFRLDLRLILSRAGRLAPEPMVRWILLRSAGFALATWEVLVISALMQAALVLPMAIYFHRATVTALPANMLVVPLTSVLMPSSAAALVLSYISESLARIPAAIAEWSLSAMTGTVKIVGGLRIADLRLPTPSLLMSTITVASLAIALMLARRKRIAAMSGLMLVVLTAFMVISFPARPDVRPGNLEVTAIDVGQADSTFIVSPHGQTLLLDAAGPLGFSRSSFDFGENVVSPYLWARGFARLDVIAISHVHSDHVGGMLSVINNFKPRELWTAPLPSSAAAAAILQCAKDAEVHVRVLEAGEEFEWAGAHVKVLGPARGEPDNVGGQNDRSLALRISYGETAVLLEGDSEAEEEHFIAQQQPKAAVLKVAHNGSLTSTSTELLAAVRPQYAFISVGSRNQFRHPRPEVLARLEARGVRTYRTDTMGLLTFLLDGKKVTPLQ